jgi:transposase InsO family protein
MRFVATTARMTSRHSLACCVERKIKLVHIQPDKPTQNAHVESFHGRLREECLTVRWFQNLFDARPPMGGSPDKSGAAILVSMPDPKAYGCDAPSRTMYGKRQSSNRGQNHGHAPK